MDPEVARQRLERRKQRSLANRQRLNQMLNESGLDHRISEDFQISQENNISKAEGKVIENSIHSKFQIEKNQQNQENESKSIINISSPNNASVQIKETEKFTFKQNEVDELSNSMLENYKYNDNGQIKDTNDTAFLNNQSKQMNNVNSETENEGLQFKINKEFETNNITELELDNRNDESAPDKKHLVSDQINSANQVQSNPQNFIFAHNSYIIYALATILTILQIPFGFMIILFCDISLYVLSVQDEVDKAIDNVLLVVPIIYRYLSNFSQKSYTISIIIILTRLLIIQFKGE